MKPDMIKHPYSQALVRKHVADTIEKILNDKMQDFDSLYEELSPKEKIDVLFRLIAYVVPRASVQNAEIPESVGKFYDNARQQILKRS